MTKFCIFSFPRSGSTFLCSLLGSHPEILCHFEVFHPLEIVTIKDFDQMFGEMRSFTPQSRDEEPGEFLNTLFRCDMGRKAVGFKIFVDHSEKAHDIILKDREIKKILLKRNTIDAYTSMLIAQKTGAFTHKDIPSGTSSDLRVSFDVDGFLGFDWKVGEYFLYLERALRETGQDFLEIHYEDLASDENTVDSIFSFLDIERGEGQLSAFTKKQNRKALQEKVEDLEQAFRDLTSAYLKMTKTNEESHKYMGVVIEGLKSQLQGKESELQERESRLQDMYNSLSWKLTSPLRKMGSKVRRRQL
jgi:LPS sulfotransferase NodH